MGPDAPIRDSVWPKEIWYLFIHISCLAFVYLALLFMIVKSTNSLHLLQILDKIFETFWMCRTREDDACICEGCVWLKRNMGAEGKGEESWALKVKNRKESSFSRPYKIQSFKIWMDWKERSASILPPLFFIFLFSTKG